MKTILLATDFSHAASNAANYAVDMALAIGAQLYVLHVYEMPFTYIDIPVATIAEELQEDAEKYMLKLQQELTVAAKGQLPIEAAVKEGNFFETLQATCERIQPYAVVIGSQGKTAAERLIYGSHTAYVMQHLEWPVIAVPLNATFSGIKRVGLACDFEDVLGTVPVEEIKILVNDCHAELHVLNLSKKEQYNPEVLDQSALLQRMFGKIIPMFHFLADHNPDDGIVQFAATNHIDLLIVVPRHHSLIDKLIHSSHTKQLVLHSHVPVIAFHHHFIKSTEVV